MKQKFYQLTTLAQKSRYMSDRGLLSFKLQIDTYIFIVITVLELLNSDTGPSHLVLCLVHNTVGSIKKVKGSVSML